MKEVLFNTPVNASNYIAGAGTVKGIAIRQLDFTSGKASVSLINSDGSIRPEVNGADISDPEDATFQTIAADVRAEVAATNS